MYCNHPALSATICESCMGPTICYVANVGIKEKAFKDADPTRQAVVKVVPAGAGLDPLRGMVLTLHVVVSLVYCTKPPFLDEATYLIAMDWPTGGREQIPPNN
jgi:hypothetical protein